MSAKPEQRGSAATAASNLVRGFTVLQTEIWRVCRAGFDRHGLAVASLWLRLFPEIWQGYRWEAHCLLARHQREEAIHRVIIGLNRTRFRPAHLIEASNLLHAAGACEEALHCAQLLIDAQPERQDGWVLTAHNLMRLRRFHEAKAVVDRGLERFPQCVPLLDLRSTPTTLLPFEQIDLDALIKRQHLDGQFVKSHGQPSQTLVLEETENLALILANKALLTDAYGAFDSGGAPLDGCFFYRAGVFVHGRPQSIVPPSALDCLEIPLAIYINNIELRHFGHRLTDGCSSIYPLLLWARQRPLRDAITIVTNRQLTDRVPELIELLDLNPDQVLIPTVNTGYLLVQQLLTPVPSMLNGGIIRNGGYVNRHHPTVVKELIRRSHPAASSVAPRTTSDSSSLMSLGCTASVDEPVSNPVDPVDKRHCGPKLYLSRSKLSSQQRLFLDEVELEQELSQRGWTIFHPQEHPLPVQMGVLTEASSICSTQGSALHLLLGVDPDPGLRLIMLTGTAVNVNYINQFRVLAIDYHLLACLNSIGNAHEHWLQHLKLNPKWTPQRLAHAIDALALKPSSPAPDGEVRLHRRHRCGQSESSGLIQIPDRRDNNLQGYCTAGFPSSMQGGQLSIFTGRSRRISPRGQKRRFGVAGIVNVAITNLVLQLLLASNLVSVLLATLISQGLNTILGYLIYGKLVFKAEDLRHHSPVLKYLSLMAGIWLLNSGLIKAGESAGISRNLSAAALIPVLAVISYAAQKSWIFRQ